MDPVVTPVVGTTAVAGMTITTVVAVSVGMAAVGFLAGYLLARKVTKNQK